MTEYFLDDDWNLVKAPATNSDLATWANVFQQMYFPGCEPNITITVNMNPKFGGAAAFDPTTMTIHVAERITPLENLAKICLLHEMIHVKLYAENRDADENHGRRFKAEIDRLTRAGAYDALL
jgi:hypothetical protein